MKTNITEEIEVTITTSDDITYRANVDTDGKVSIAQQQPGMWLWAGDGKWDGTSIADCSADLGDEAYEMLDEAIQAAIEEQSADEDTDDNIEDAGPGGTRIANRLRDEEEDRLDAQYGPAV